MVAITIAGLSAAVALALIAAALTTTRGNRISDYNQKNGAALNVQILNQLKIATSVPIVALYFIAVAAGLGTPGLASILQTKPTKTSWLSGPLPRLLIADRLSPWQANLTASQRPYA
jgi:hypothetical protein